VVARDAAAHDALIREATSLAVRLGVGHLELRNQHAPEANMLTKDLYVTFRAPMDPDPEKNLLAIPRKQRAMIRKGIDAGLTSELDTDTDRCYKTYSDSVRHLGTPVFGRHYFRILKEVFGNDCDVLTVMRKEKLVASVLSFYFRDQVLPYYGGDQRDNVTDSRERAAAYLGNPTAVPGILDLYPRSGQLVSGAMDTAALQGFRDWNRDFNGTAYDARYRGAYSGAGINPGWLPRVEIKPAVGP
jgi:hypothetical protein